MSHTKDKFEESQKIIEKMCYKHSDPTRGFWRGGIFFAFFLVQMRVTRVVMTFLGDFMVRSGNFGSFFSIFEHFRAFLSQNFAFSDRGIFGTFFGPNACN